MEFEDIGNIRSIGEAIKIARETNLDLSSMWEILVNKLGFCLPETLPLSMDAYYWEFFEVKMLKDSNTKNMWSYYRILNDHTFIDEHNNVFDLNYKAIDFRGDYLVCIAENIVYIYYKTLEAPISEYELIEDERIPDVNIFITSEGPTVSLCKVGCAKIFYHYKNGSPEILTNASSNIGYYGSYFINDNRIKMRYYNSKKEREIYISPIYDKEIRIHSICETMDAIYKSENSIPIAIYDSYHDKIAWLNPYEREMRVIDNMAVIDNKIIDIITGMIIYQGDSSNIFITRKLNNYGYHIWKS